MMRDLQIPSSESEIRESETLGTASNLMDRINRAAWQDRESVRWFAGLDGYTDPGEKAATERVANDVRGQPILDLGVGAGRTVPLLRALSDDYTAIDYTPELVAACAEKHPEARVAEGDARDLGRFDSNTFALVVFSFNGIDAVNTEDRVRVLREVHRVLRSGGYFLFSAHNKTGPGYGERVWLDVNPTRNPLKLAARMVRALKNAPRAARNYQRYSRLNEDHDGFSIMNAAAHNHGLLIHYVTLERQSRDLVDVGFLPEIEVYENVGGTSVPSGGDTSQFWWLHYLARKP